MCIITIDSGTTNTRVNIWQSERVIADSFQEVGARDTAITGSKTTLQNGVRMAIAQVLSQANIQIANVKLILATGMIGSNLGLLEVPHVPAPAGLEELAKGMKMTIIPEVISCPIWFIPGVRNLTEEVSLENCEAMDMMRGEEVEALGIIEKLCLAGPAILILTGSHSKFIRIDGNNRIASCITTIAGELLETITYNTILANTLGKKFAEKIRAELHLKGAACSQKNGLGRACFTARILDQFTDYQRNDKANFVLGAVLANDLLALKNSEILQLTPQITVVIMGKRILKEALMLIIQNDVYFQGKQKVVADEIQRNIAGYGAILVAKQRGLL